MIVADMFKNFPPPLNAWVRGGRKAIWQDRTANPSYARFVVNVKEKTYA